MKNGSLTNFGSWDQEIDLIFMNRELLIPFHP